MDRDKKTTGFKQVRVFEIVQQKYKNDVWEKLRENPEIPLTQYDYWLTEDKIKNILEARKSIKKFVWILHDKDVYQEGEYIPKGRIVGDKKPPHFHIYGKCDDKVGVDRIAKWFGVPVNYVIPKSGYGAFYDCIEYATHESLKEQELGKYRYDDCEVHSNFDWRKELNAHVARRDKFSGNPQQLFEEMRTAVYRDGMTLDALRRWADEDDRVRNIYTKNVSMFKKLRGEWLAKQNPPDFLMNVYIEGLGGYGKGALSKMLARAFWRMLNPSVNSSELREREIHYDVADSRSGLQEYDGQQIIIWEDVRPGALMHLFGGRGATFVALDPYPKDVDYNIKYSTVKLINRINIMNSVVPFKEFAQALTTPVDELDNDEPEDLRQVTRRYCLWIVIHENDYEVMVNTGIFGLGAPKGFEDFKAVKIIDNNLIRLIGADQEIQDRNMREILDVLPKRLEKQKKVTGDLEPHVRYVGSQESADKDKHIDKRKGFCRAECNVDEKGRTA